ncbi:hypothetical protein Tco_0880262 [Tanacetum coccineum]
MRSYVQKLVNGDQVFLEKFGGRGLLAVWGGGALGMVVGGGKDSGEERGGLSMVELKVYGVKTGWLNRGVCMGKRRAENWFKKELMGDGKGFWGMANWPPLNWSLEYNFANIGLFGLLFFILKKLSGAIMIVKMVKLHRDS